MRFQPGFAAEICGVTRDFLKMLEREEVVSPRRVVNEKAVRAYSFHDLMEVWLFARLTDSGIPFRVVMAEWMPAYRSLIRQYPSGTYDNLVLTRTSGKGYGFYLAKSKPFMWGYDPSYEKRTVSVSLGDLVTQLRDLFGEKIKDEHFSLPPKQNDPPKVVMFTAPPVGVGAS